MKILILSLLILFLTDCRKKLFTEDVKECDNIGNYYEQGSHYLRRDLIKVDEFGREDYSILDMKKLMDESTRQNSRCYPLKEEQE